MKRAVSLIFGVAFTTGVISVQAQKPVPDHTFDQYSVPVYRGRAAQPNFKSLPDSERFRTRIREGFKDGVNFAGHYAIVAFGCGTDCIGGFLIDIKSGQIFNLPLGGEENYELQLDHRPDSRLLKAQWVDGMDKDPQTPICVRQEFLLTANVFKLLRTTKTPGEECED